MIAIGSISVTPVIDSVARVQPTAAYAATTPVDWSRHAALLDDDGLLPLTLGGYLVRTGDRVILVDAGIGPEDRPGKYATMPGGKLLDNLRATGTAPEEVTDVVFTHLHVDHVGWGAVDGSLPFSNAVHRCHAADWAYFSSGAPLGDPAKLAQMEPVMECWDSTTTLAPGFDVVHAPGHTPGSSIVVLSDGDQRAVLLGDVVHCPAELAEDEWETIADVDPALARRTATQLAREYEGPNVMIGAGHFDGLRFGRLLAGEASRTWAFA